MIAILSAEMQRPGRRQQPPPSAPQGLCRRSRGQPTTRHALNHDHRCAAAGTPFAAASASATSREVAYSFGSAPFLLVMLMRNRLLLGASAAIVLSGFGTVISGQPRERSVAMQWRQIGPTRAGRARALAGVPSQSNVFYIGFDNGGVWRSTDYGSTWQPIFDDQPTGSIGAIAVAPSDRNIIYVGSGAGIIRPDLAVGDGVYKSTDAGRTWTHLGLRDSQMIAMFDVDPRNPNRLFVAALGHPYGPNA